MRHGRLLTALTAVATVVTVPAVAAPAQATTGPTIVRVSTDSQGGQLDSMNDGEDITPDGRYVLFERLITVPGTPSSSIKSRLFVKDRVTGKTKPVDVARGGGEPDGNVFGGKVSANGRYVVFGSAATNLVAHDTNGKPDVFRRDLRNGKIARISTGYKGTAGSGSAGGIYVSISANGNRIAFDSDATDLVPHDTNGTRDIFVRTVSAGVTKRVSVNSSGRQSEPEPAKPSSVYLKTRDSSEPVISADGTTVAFSSYASNLVKGDTNQTEDVFTHSLATGKTKRVSLRANGSQSKTGDRYGGGASEPSISANGKVVAFYSVYTDLLASSSNHPNDVYVHHVTTGKNELAEVTLSGGSGGWGARNPILSPSRKSVAFYTQDKDVVAGDENGGPVLRNLVTGKAHRIGTTRSGQPYTLSSAITAVANDKTVLFQSAASNVVPNDTNDNWDTFVATF